MPALRSDALRCTCLTGLSGCLHWLNAASAEVAQAWARLSKPGRLAVFVNTVI